MCNSEYNRKIKNYDRQQTLFRDSMGFYDEIVHDNGRFVRFAPLRETDANIAYQKLMRKKIEG